MSLWSAGVEKHDDDREDHSQVAWLRVETKEGVIVTPQLFFDLFEQVVFRLGSVRPETRPLSLRRLARWARGQLLIGLFEDLERGVVVEHKVNLLQAAARLQVVEHFFHHDLHAILEGKARRARTQGGDGNAFDGFLFGAQQALAGREPERLGGLPGPRAPSPRAGYRMCLSGFPRPVPCLSPKQSSPYRA